MDHDLTIPKIRRILRPLVSKLHRLSELQLRNSHLLDLVIPVDIHSKYIQKLVSPANAHDRLFALKRFLDPELYSEYQDLFAIFLSILMTLHKVYCSNNKDLVSGSLSTLCCLTLGKHIVVGSKTSYFKLNQAILFENDTAVEEVPDDIDDWFSMEPSYIFNKYRFQLLIGYLVHLLVFHTNKLYFLIPSLAEWLKELYKKTGVFIYYQMSQHLYKQYWMYNYLDYADGQWSHHDAYWHLFDFEYWDYLQLRLDFPNVDFLDNLRLNHRVELKHLDHILGRLIQKPQHPDSTEILALLVKEILGNCRVKHSTRVELESLYTNTLSNLMKVAQTWLTFRADVNRMVFDSLLPGNELIFSSLIHCSNYVRQMSENIYKQQQLFAFKDISEEAEKVMKILSLMKSYYLDTEAEYIPDKADSIRYRLGDYTLFWFTDFNDRAAGIVKISNMSNVQLNDYLSWLKDIGAPWLAQNILSSYYYYDFSECEMEERNE